MLTTNNSRSTQSEARASVKKNCLAISKTFKAIAVVTNLSEGQDSSGQGAEGRTQNEKKNHINI